MALPYYAYKYYYTGNGVFIVDQDFSSPNATDSPVNNGSIITASITELVKDRPPDITGIQPWPPHMGDAKMSVLNVTPSDNGHVYTRVNIDWPAPLPFQLCFIIVNP